MSKPPRLGELHELVSGIRIGQFLSVGIIGFIVDQLVLTLLIELGGTSVIVGKPLSAEAAIIVMFILNERWTFAAWGKAGGRNVVSRFLKSNFVRVGGVLVAYVILLILHQWFGVHYLIANTIGIGIGFVVNYIAESLFTWRVGIFHR
jgi:putative flippase GtrA